MKNRFPNAERRPTIEDVATLAGVSKGTVSKVINGGNYYVSEAMRDRIAAAVAELEFQPNAIARDLGRRRTDTVGVVVANIANPLYPEMIKGVSDVLDESSLTVILGTSDGSAAKEAELVQAMRQRQVDGVIIASVRMGRDEVAELVASGLEVVLASRNLPHDGLVTSVIVDNYDGGVKAVRHLVSHGHRRIAHIAGPQDVVPFVERRRAYLDECARSGLDVEATLVAQAAESSPEDGAAAMEQLLDLPTPPTAVFVGSDTMAMGALEVCDQRRLTIPRDLAVVSFDNVWVSRMPGVQLTTVDSRAHELGRLAAQELVARIEKRRAGEGRQEPRQMVLEANLVVRKSCGCVPA